MTMKILITGAKGLLGEALSAYAKIEGFQVLETDVSELDITRSNQVRNVIRGFNPDVILNCAVIDPINSEKSPKLATKVNVIGMKNILKNKCNSKLVHFSSPAVFDGLPALENKQLRGDFSYGYKETDLPKPTTVYGKTKLESEKLLEGTDSLIIRTSWLYSENQLLTRKAYATNEIARPTYCGDVWKFIVTALKEDLHGLYHVCGPDVMSRHEQAKLLFGKVKKENLPIPNIRPLSTARSFEYFKKQDQSLTYWKQFIESLRLPPK